jgi:hypothetical protein
VKRPISTLLLVALTALPGLRLAVAVQDTEAMRCAIACGHAAGQMGASCCPIGGFGETGPSFKTCSPGDSFALTSVASQPAVLAAVGRLTAAQPHRLLHPESNAAPRAATSRPLDHVPLLLG